MILVLVEVVKNIKNVVVNNEEILSYFHPYYFNSLLIFFIKIIFYPTQNIQMKILIFKLIKVQMIKTMMVLMIKVILYKMLENILKQSHNTKANIIKVATQHDHYGVCSDVVAFGLLNYWI